MATYARLNGSTVAEIFTTPRGFSIADCFHSDLIWVPCDSPPGVAVGWIATRMGNRSWLFSEPPPPPGPTLAVQAAQLLATGLAVTSTATPVLDGTYAVDDTSRADVVAIETSLNAGKGFPPSGADSFLYPDKAGFFHTFNATDFTNLAAAMRDFVYACKAVIGGASETLPPGTATIP